MPVQVACRSGEDLIRGREEASGCQDVKKQVSILRDRYASVLERARARKDRVLGAADRPIVDLKSDVRIISVWIQEAWKDVTVIINGEGHLESNKRRLQVCLKLT